MRQARSAFTLIEVLVAIAIAMVLVGVSTTALVQIRRMVRRAELRIQLHQRAAAISTHLDNLFAAVQHTAPLIVDASTSGSPAQVRVRLVALTSKIDNWDWTWPREGGNESHTMAMDTSDLRWQLLEWHGESGDQCLYAATSRPSRTFQILTPLVHNGVDFQDPNRSWLNLPQPRRSLGPVTTWAAATAALDDNLLFPNPASPGTYPDLPQRSLASPHDVGDWGDLLSQRVPIAAGVTDFRLAIATLAASTQTFDQTGSAFQAYDGVWLDSSISGTHGTFAGPVATVLAGPIGQRPRLIRVRLTLEERLRPRDPLVPDSDETRIQQTFAFSFLLPGNAGPPTGP